ncbi:THAP domain-containing protein 2 [Merluccius polli]|uniref:THAP domain-containing protein 2 n=1 Tax=Merluccius polli TaxID=89951 RepID=A0AA47MLG1_MERPO|nr:THAP domain-containing protein 2 [Merluccius polli]
MASRSKAWCCVPQCTNSKQKQPYLTFHKFPRDDDRRRAWIWAIKREEGPQFNADGAQVCSIHFSSGDMLTTAGGLTKIKQGATPSVFPWVTARPSARRSVYERSTERLGFDVCSSEGGSCGRDDGAVVGVSVGLDHDYLQQTPGALDVALARIEELEAQVRRLTLVQELQLSRYCVSDGDFRFYTRFPSESIFRKFWQAIEPSASVLVYWSKAQRMGLEAMAETGPSPQRKLPLIDEFFLYCLHTAVGLKEKILGQMPLWLTRGEVRRRQPQKFREFCPDVRVILDCTELRCETPSALTLHSSTYSTYKSHTTFKGLIGVSPSGTVTFVSKLYSGGISDKEITRKSGILGLLENGDAVMADKGFLIENMLSTVGAKLIIPPFKHKAQFSRQETEQTQAIARLRVLVERVIRRVKEFHIFDTVIPLTVAGSINQIWTNCCVLVNFQGPMELDHAAEVATPSVP